MFKKIKNKDLQKMTLRQLYRLEKSLEDNRWIIRTCIIKKEKELYPPKERAF